VLGGGLRSPNAFLVQVMIDNVGDVFSGFLFF